MKTVEIKQVNIKDIKPEPELEKFLPKLDEVATEKLKTDILENGIREPLVLAEYNGKIIILDGHNRFGIASSKPSKFPVVPAEFRIINDLTDAKVFMLNNQLGKRNLSTMERVIMVLQLEPELTAAAKARKKMTKEEKEQNSEQSKGRVIEQLAKLADKSRDTITKVKAILRDAIPAVVAAADKDISIDIAHKISELPAEQQEAALADATRKPTIERPESNRRFTCGAVEIEENTLIIDLADEFIGRTETGVDGCIVLGGDEKENIEKIKAAAEYFTELATQLKQAAKIYKTPPPPKTPKADKAEKQAIKEAKIKEKADAKAKKIADKAKEKADKKAKAKTTTKKSKTTKTSKAKKTKETAAPAEPTFNTTLGEAIKSAHLTAAEQKSLADSTAKMSPTKQETVIAEAIEKQSK